MITTHSRWSPSALVNYSKVAWSEGSSGAEDNRSTGTLYYFTPFYYFLIHPVEPVTSTTSSPGGSATMAYDFAAYKVAAPVSRTAEGVTVRTTYDNLGRITKETHPDGTFSEMAYLVNATQNLITSADELVHKSRLKHNPFGQVAHIVTQHFVMGARI